MSFWKKETWGYAVLLIILFCIAAIAVTHMLGFLHAQAMPAETYRVAAVIMWSLTLGFMLIAGAYGVWAIQFAAEAESRRRIGRMVDHMDYFQDGLLAIDEKGRISGANPAALRMTGATGVNQQPVTEAFPCLSEVDVSLFLSSSEPMEMEKTLSQGDATYTFRFRSQPSEGLTLLLTSDVSGVTARRQYNRQRAMLQLVGQIARGVAHDFNNILCGISGHASLLPRLQPGSPEMKDSSEAIVEASERGIEMAGQLMRLCQPIGKHQSAVIINDYIQAAERNLRDSLEPGWKIQTSLQDLPTIGLTGMQVEQIIVNLGLMAADALKKRGVLEIETGRPGSGPLFNIEHHFAGALVISVSTEEDSSSSKPRTIKETRTQEGGVIESVIRSAVEESGGRLEALVDDHGLPLYRVNLPYAIFGVAAEDAGGMPEEVGAYIKDWTVMIGAPESIMRQLRRRFEYYDIQVQQSEGIASILTAVNSEDHLDALIIHENLLQDQIGGVLKAILKLRPSTSIVVLCRNIEDAPDTLMGDVTFVDANAEPTRIVLSMIDAKALAVKRMSA